MALAIVSFIFSGGTWEHKLRMREMDATKDWADELTRQSRGKHHMGDFLPPEELAKFMETYQVLCSYQVMLSSSPPIENECIKM